MGNYEIFKTSVMIGATEVQEVIASARENDSNKVYFMKDILENKNMLEEMERQLELSLKVTIVGKVPLLVETRRKEDASNGCINFAQLFKLLPTIKGTSKYEELMNKFDSAFVNRGLQFKTRELYSSVEEITDYIIKQQVGNISTTLVMPTVPERLIDPEKINEYNDYISENKSKKVLKGTQIQNNPDAELYLRIPKNTEELLNYAKSDERDSVFFPVLDNIKVFEGLATTKPFFSKIELENNASKYENLLDVIYGKDENNDLPIQENELDFYNDLKELIIDCYVTASETAGVELSKEDAEKTYINSFNKYLSQRDENGERSYRSAIIESLREFLENLVDSAFSLNYFHSGMMVGYLSTFVKIAPTELIKHIYKKDTADYTEEDMDSEGFNVNDEGILNTAEESFTSVAILDSEVENTLSASQIDTLIRMEGSNGILKSHINRMVPKDIADMVVRLLRWGNRKPSLIKVTLNDEVRFFDVYTMVLENKPSKLEGLEPKVWGKEKDKYYLHSIIYSNNEPADQTIYKEWNLDGTTLRYPIGVILKMVYDGDDKIESLLPVDFITFMTMCNDLKVYGVKKDSNGNINIDDDALYLLMEDTYGVATLKNETGSGPSVAEVLKAIKIRKLKVNKVVNFVRTHKNKHQYFYYDEDGEKVILEDTEGERLYNSTEETDYVIEREVIEVLIPEAFRVEETKSIVVDRYISKFCMNGWKNKSDLSDEEFNRNLVGTNPFKLISDWVTSSDIRRLLKLDTSDIKSLMQAKADAVIPQQGNSNIKVMQYNADTLLYVTRELGKLYKEGIKKFEEKNNKDHLLKIVDIWDRAIKEGLELQNLNKESQEQETNRITINSDEVPVKLVLDSDQLIPLTYFGTNIGYCTRDNNKFNLYHKNEITLGNVKLTQPDTDEEKLLKILAHGVKNTDWFKNTVKVHSEDTIKLLSKSMLEIPGTNKNFQLIYNSYK